MQKVVFLGVLGALLPLVPARAVVLQQKWQAGQQLSYATTLRGVANVQAPANAPFIFAGVPIEVAVRGDGVAQLQTLSVDEAGVGTVALRVPRFDLRAQALGQNGQLSLQDAQSRATINGKAVKFGDGKNPLAQPQVAWQISPQGKFVGFKNLGPQTATRAPQNAKPVDPAQAVDRSALLAASIVRALPALWPNRDVQNGETWKATLLWPAPKSGGGTVPTQFGAWNLTFKGSETVAGQSLQRVGVEGTLSVDSAQFRAATAAAPRGQTTQTVNGDLWLDAQAGRIARADLQIGARAQGGQSEDALAKADFKGTLQLNLQDGA